MNARRLAGTTVAFLILACHHPETAVPQQSGPPIQSAITITPALPADIPGGAENADLKTAAEFAWQQFIALNWPAKNGGAIRGRPDEQALFADRGGVPLVWETFRSKVEIYPPGGGPNITPHGYAKGAPDYGWNDPPQYPYFDKDAMLPVMINPCGAPSPHPAWINLDEISQVGFDYMHAGAALGNTDEEKMIRFTAKANENHYRYVAGNEYWYSSERYQLATNNFTKAVSSGEFQRGTTYVLFPVGTMEAKAAFRRLTPQERNSGRFHVARVRYYERSSAGPCYREEEWGLLALHIIQKTPTAPAYTWATFEQADNLQTAQGHSIEDPDGKIVVPGLPADTPGQAYQDGLYADNTAQKPCVSIAGKTTPPCVADPASVPFCRDPAARLFYAEIRDVKGQPLYNRIPAGGNICVTGRDHPIPDTIIGVNREAHAVIADYDKKHGLPVSPWRYYKLVNVQAYPFDKAVIGNDPARRATYYTSNIVVETDYTLQHHSGGPETKTGAAPSDLAANFPPQVPPNGDPQTSTYQNAYILNPDGTFKKRYNMGGCTGCHGEAQVLAGTDYSYIMVQPVADQPETAGHGEKTLRGRYQELLNDRMRR
jgi:hypothetical protein